MATLITMNVIRGQTSLDTFKPKVHIERLVRIPGLQVHFTLPNRATEVSALLPGERLYDLGWRQNLRLLTSQQLLSSQSIHKKWVRISVTN